MHTRTLILLVACLTMGPACSDEARSATGETCANNTDCMDNVCHSGICVARNPLQNGSSCQGGAYCRSLSCAGGTCVQNSKGAGSICLYSEECASSACVQSACGTGGAVDGGVGSDGARDPLTCGPSDDPDGDGFKTAQDNCPYQANPAQEDTDKDEKGDLCDTDDDNDGVLDVDDNCPLVYNPLQESSIPTTFGSACYRDTDKDAVIDSKDNCPAVFNPQQQDTNGNGRGDTCDIDLSKCP